MLFWSRFINIILNSSVLQNSNITLSFLKAYVLYLCVFRGWCDPAIKDDVDRKEEAYIWSLLAPVL